MEELENVYIRLSDGLIMYPIRYTSESDVKMINNLLFNYHNAEEPPITIYDLNRLGFVRLNTVIKNSTMNTNIGVMEHQATIGDIMENLIRLIDRGEKLIIRKVENSENHNGKTMYVLSEDPKDDVSIYHLEISEAGIFPYIFDDGVS